MSKINLLYVITKLELGGAQKQLLSIISNLDKERFNLFLFTGRQGLLLSDACSIKGLCLECSRWLEWQINPLKDPVALFKIYRFIKKNNIQIVHTHSSKAGILGRLAARLARVRVIIHTVHGWSFNDYQPLLLRRACVWLERFCARFTDKLIVASCYDKQKGLDNRIGSPDKYRLIRYGIDYSEFSLRDQDIRKELGINNGDLVIGMVSCLKPQKSPQDFIKLASLVTQSLPDVKFLLIGDGVLLSGVKELINRFKLQGKVILTGWRRDIQRVLPAIDIFTLTSLWEGLPIAVLEAVVSSIPVVATNTGGVAEVIVEGKTGFLVLPHDMQGMSERLVLLLKDANLRRQMAENAKHNLGLNFTLQNMVENSQGLYEGLFKAKF